MDTNIAIVVTIVVLGGVVIFFFVRFGGKGKFRIKSKFGEVNAEGENPPSPAAIPAGVKIKDAQAGGDLRAYSGGSGGVDLEKITAKGHIEATNSPEASSPK